MEDKQNPTPTLQTPPDAQPPVHTAPVQPSLKEEMAAAEAQLTPQEQETLKATQQELIGKFLVLGCVWGVILGALISRFLLGGSWLDGVYSGIVVGMLLGLGAGWIFGALEKAMLLQRVGKYAPKPDAAQPGAPSPDSADTQPPQ